jgi:PKD repeat protein
MKKIVVVASIIMSQLSFAQEAIKFCGHGEAMEELYKNDPEAKKRIEKNNKQLADADAEAFKNGYENYPNGYFNSTTKNNSSNSTQGIVYTIPVVFHVLHQNGVEKIAPSQIKDAIRILNVDYNKLNPDTSDVIPDFVSRIGDVEFNFVLATKDPLGNCTNGIVYHETASADWTSGTSGPYTGTSSGKWNPTKYLNIYTVKTISSGAAGYTYLPGSWSTGSGNDCIIILHNYVGSIGTGQVSRSRALTHEVGHWFNLPHVWGGNNTPGTACGDEGVSDTPITKGYDYCPSGATQSQICNAGVSENYQNYMDYSYCSVMFTTGQATRMRTAITSSTSGRSTLWSTNNLTFTGVSNPQPCIPQAFFTTVSNRKLLCTGSNVQFKDSTWNTTVTGWQWSFPGGTPSTSTDSMPLITYNSAGIYPVSYTASTSSGTGTVSVTNYITVSSNTASVQSSFTEGFENISVPNTDWKVDNTSDGVYWKQSNTIGSSGTKSMFINNFSNTANDVEVFYTPSYNVSGINAANPGTTFTFKLAYQRPSTASSEKLQVYSSTNCGQTWSLRYSKTGSALATVSTTNTSSFVPTSTQWRTESVSISSLLSQSNVWFKFVFTSDPNGSTNNIYIDDINIGSQSVGIHEQAFDFINFNVYPNPTKGNFKTEFELIESDNVLIQFVDLLGKVQHELKLDNLNAGSHEFDIQVPTDLSNGIYFLKLNTNKGTKTIKMAIEK